MKRGQLLLGRLLPTSLRSVETGLVTLRNIVGNFAILVLAVAMLVMVWQEMTSNAIRIQSIQVDDEVLLNRGLTGRVLMVKLLEQMNEIEEEAWTSMERNDIGVEEEDNLPDSEIPGTGLSITDFLAFAKAFGLNGAPRITGEALTIGDQRDELQITILMSGSQALTVRKSLEEEDAVDALLREVAEFVYRENRRILYAFYIHASSIKETDPQQKRELQRKALEVLEQVVTGKLSDEERARIYNLWGLILTDQGALEYDEGKNQTAKKKFDLAIEKFDRAMETKWYERLLGSDRGWYAELMKARAFSIWHRYSEAVMMIEGFITDYPDKAEKGRDSLRVTYHNWGIWYGNHCSSPSAECNQGRQALNVAYRDWGIWYIDHCPGSSEKCKPAGKFMRDLSRAFFVSGETALLYENDRDTALQHAWRAEQLAVDKRARKDACELLTGLIRIMDDLPEFGSEPVTETQKRCKQILSMPDSL